jgi:Cytochrome P450
LLTAPEHVSAPDGIELASAIKAPKGVQIEIPMHSIHMDDGFYRDAAQYKPFRFADGSGPRKDGMTHSWDLDSAETVVLGASLERIS